MTRGVQTPFVVLTFPRTGSAWLIDMLHSHPEVVAYPEVFLSGGGPARYAGADLAYFEDYLLGLPSWARAVRSVHRMAYLRMLYRRRPGIRATGFKLMYGQARAQPGVLRYLTLRRTRLIHLVRANLLDTLISYQVAKKVGVFHPSRGQHTAPQTGVSLDVARLRDRLEGQELAVARARAKIERYRFPRLEIEYEELVRHREVALDRVLRFLGVDPRVELESSLVRMIESRHVDRVVNIDAVRDALRGTRFEWMLLGEGGPGDG